MSRRLAHHTPLLKIPVWWRRAVLPLPPFVCPFSFFLSFWRKKILAGRGYRWEHVVTKLRTRGGVKRRAPLFLRRDGVVDLQKTHPKCLRNTRTARSSAPHSDVSGRRVPSEARVTGAACSAGYETRAAGGSQGCEHRRFQERKKTERHEGEGRRTGSTPARAGFWKDDQGDRWGSPAPDKGHDRLAARCAVDSHIHWRSPLSLATCLQPLSLAVSRYHTGTLTQGWQGRPLEYSRVNP